MYILYGKFHRSQKKKKKKKKKFVICSSPLAESFIKDLIKDQEDAELSARVGSIDFRAKKSSTIRSVDRIMLILIEKEGREKKEKSMQRNR